MRILHLSDFHYKTSYRDVASQSLLVDRLIEALKEQPKIDFVLFTGDLVFSGTDYTDFDLATEQLLKRISIALEVEKPNVLLCPGNHDVDRTKVVVPIKDYIRKIKKFG